MGHAARRGIAATVRRGEDHHTVIVNPDDAFIVILGDAQQPG